MAKTPVQLQQLDSAVNKQLGSFVDLPKIDVPFTTIVNRAQCTDFSNDLRPRMGIERISFDRIQEVFSESNSSGQQVYKLSNDPHEAVRFVGSWGNGGDSHGSYIAGGTNDYAEFTFFGTGLNLLIRTVGSDDDYRVSVDGGSEGADIYTASFSVIIQGRNYQTNTVLPAVSGLSQGLHTVKIRVAGTSARWYGFEIINNASSVKITPGSAFLGGRKTSLNTIDTQTYNSGFESGVLGTRGGRVVTYLQDGEIKKVVTPTDASQLNLSAASHANEDVVRTYNWREFGAGRSDDFSLATKAVALDRAFTLDDGVTTLLGKGTREATASTGLICDGDNQFIIFTFVGTGLDIVAQTSGTGASVSVDGTSIGSISGITTFSVVKVVSGLPYGTHAVRIQRGTAGNTIEIDKFIVYQPKKPSVPSDAIELADYCILADYVQSVPDGQSRTSQGVLRKMATRELTYVGTYNISEDVDSHNCGFNITTTTTGNTYQYTFFGTGLDLRWYSSTVANNFSVAIDGSTNLSGYTTNIVSSGSLAFTAGTGTVTGTPGSGTLQWLSVRDLPLGLHTIVVTRLGSHSGNLYIDCLDIITPIYAPYDKDTNLQNTTSVGSNAIRDSRVFAETVDIDIPNWSQAVGVASAPSTTSTDFIPVADMTCTVKTTGKPIEIFWFMDWYQNTTGATAQALAQLYVDGVAVGGPHSLYVATSGFSQATADRLIVPVAAGIHNIQLRYRTTNASFAVTAATRSLSVKEL